jgi:hypothetical protein
MRVQTTIAPPPFMSMTAAGCPLNAVHLDARDVHREDDVVTCELARGRPERCVAD